MENSVPWNRKPSFAIKITPALTIVANCLEKITTSCGFTAFLPNENPPPFFLGFSAAFSISVATLSLPEGEKISWYNYMKPFVMIAWSFLTIGIAFGSIWAYYELGWGGWWFWDPVENASFMPWLIGTALLLSLVIVEKR